MKKLLILSAIAAFTLGSCRETIKTETVTPTPTHTKEVIREVHVETKEVAPDRDGILERTGKQIDKKVNEKIDEKIEKID